MPLAEPMKCTLEINPVVLYYVWMDSSTSTFTLRTFNETSVCLMMVMESYSPLSFSLSFSVWITETDLHPTVTLCRLVLDFERYDEISKAKWPGFSG